MARFLRMFRKKALQVAPEPEGSSCHLPKEQSSPSFPAGGEAAPIQARRWKCPGFWKRKPASGAGTELGEAPTRPKWSWLRIRLRRQDPAQEGRRAGWLWGLLCGQHQPLEPSPDSQQEASPCPVTEDLPASPGQEVEDPCPSTNSSAWDSSSSWDSGSSEANGHRCFVPGTPRDSEDEEEGEWVNMATDETAFKVIREQLQGREKELIEELPDNSPPGAVLANSLIAVGNLSTMKPALQPELETHLRAALHAVFTLGTEKDTTQVQALHKVLPERLDAMLGNLLTESPDTDRLHYILEISVEFSSLGHHVAQLALFVSDPDKVISQQAREGTYWLYQLLLQQKGLTIHEAEDLWCWDWHQDSRLLGYRNTDRVGEVFRKFFSEGQRRYFLRMAVLAIHDPLLRVSQVRLVLAYCLLGEPQQLTGDKEMSGELPLESVPSSIQM
ncbi:unnamed protein product [Caretta caretta]